MPESGEITELLVALRDGRPDASDRLIPLVYTELKQIARSHMRRERSDHTLQPTALVNEAWMKLVGQRNLDWKNRAHFFGVAAHLMRLILVDHARKVNNAKHGGGVKPLPLEKIQIGGQWTLDSALLVDAALVRLAEVDERLVKVVELRFFANLTVEESAEILGVAAKTVQRDWQFARTLLAGFLEPGPVTA